VHDKEPRADGAALLATVEVLARAVMAQLELRRLRLESRFPAQAPALTFDGGQLPIPIARILRSGRLGHANRALLACTSMTQEELASRGLAAWLDRDVVRALLADDFPSEGLECHFLRKGGERLPMLMHRCPSGPDGWVVTFTPTDVVQESLQAAHRRTQNIVESVADGFVALDRDWRYTFVNQRAGEMFGRDPGELVGKRIWDEFPDGVGQPFHRAYLRALEEQVPLSIEAYYEPWRRWFENRIYPSPEGVTIFFTEITDRKRVDEELRNSRDRLRALSTRLQRMREQENARIARSIHDELGQTLAALDMGLSTLSHHLGLMPPEARPHGLDCEARLFELRQVVRDAMEAERRITSELRPAILDELGLSAALRWYAEEFQRQTGIACRFRDQAEGASAAGEAATALFRIFQEALTNVARHSGARKVEAVPSAKGEGLSLEIEDDGRGLDPSAVGHPFSVGLLGMQERAQTFGGEVRFGQRPGGGTRLVARVALSP
jgi:PAS domain S-box-containing protein